VLPADPNAPRYTAVEKTAGAA